MLVTDPHNCSGVNNLSIVLATVPAHFEQFVVDIKVIVVLTVSASIIAFLQL